MIKVGPTGYLIRGDILDVNKKALEERLQDIDSQLYVIWNPTKLRGEGCWELRRRPELKTALHVATYQGMSFYEVDYLESGINHIKDFPFLNYKILEWVKEKDLWAKFNYNGKTENTKEFLNKMEEAEFRVRDEATAKNLSEMKYGIMQDKKIIRNLRESILSGVNPHLIGAHWNKAGR